VPSGRYGCAARSPHYPLLVLIIRRGLAIVLGVFGTFVLFGLVHLIALLNDPGRLVQIDPSPPVAIACLISIVIGSFILAVIAWPRRNRSRTSN